MASTDSPRGRSEQREDPSSRFRKARSISRRVTVSLLAVAGSGSFSSMPGTRSTGVVLVEANIVAGKEHEPDHEIYNDAPPRDRADVRDDAPVLGAGIEGEDSQDFQMTELLMDDAEFSDVDEDGTAAQLMQEGEAQTRTTTKVPTPYRCAVNTIGLSSTCMYKRLWFGAKWEAAADDCCKYNSAKSKCSWTGSKGCPREPGMEAQRKADDAHEARLLVDPALQRATGASGRIWREQQANRLREAAAAEDALAHVNPASHGATGASGEIWREQQANRLRRSAASANAADANAADALALVDPASHEATGVSGEIWRERQRRRLRDGVA